MTVAMVVLKAAAVMAEFEGNILLTWVCCHGSWLLLAEVHLSWVMDFACLPWVVAFDC